VVGGQSGQTVHDSISKIIRAKWTGGVAKDIEHLLCKHEALSSNSNPTKKIFFQTLKKMNLFKST
jgi:hypothetical protein